jgi:hypothetical protein
MRKRGEAELPPPYTRRWTFRRKAALLQALRSRTITFEQARERYALSAEELRAWERDFQRQGLYGLRATRAQLYRDEEP